MWLSKSSGVPLPPESSIVLGKVTLAEDELAVFADGELRSLPLFGPAGISWRPSVGDDVLILKSGDEAVIVGVKAENSAPGRLSLSARGAEITLYDGGAVSVAAQGAEIFVSSQGLSASCGGASLTLGSSGVMLSAGGNFISVGSGGIEMSSEPVIRD